MWEGNFHALAVLTSQYCLYSLKILLHKCFSSLVSTFALLESNTLPTHWIFLSGFCPNLSSLLTWILALSNLYFHDYTDHPYDYISQIYLQPRSPKEFQVHISTRLLQIPNNHKNQLSSLYVYSNLLLLMILILVPWNRLWHENLPAGNFRASILGTSVEE